MRTIRGNLLLQFCIAAFVVVVILMGTTTFLMRSAFKDMVLRDAADDAVSASGRMVSSFLSEADLRGLITGQRYSDASAYVQNNVLSDRTARVKIWSRTGQVLFSTDRTQVGTTKPIKEDLGEALGGVVSAALLERGDAEDAAERELGALVEVYAPIVMPNSTEVVGAFEIYQFWSPYQGQLDRIEGVLYASMAAGGVVLYVSLFFVVRSGWLTILRQRRVEKERRTLESIMSSMGEGLVVADAQGSVIHCNRAAEQLLGIQGRDAIGKPARALYESLSSRAIQPAGWLDPSAMAGGAEGPKKLCLVLQQPQRKEIEANMFEIDAEGTRLGTGAVLRDISREREIDRMKTELVSVASHELRVPTTVIQGFAELLLLRANEIADTHRPWVQTISDESKRLAALVEDTLNISRIESSDFSLELVPVDVASVANDLVKKLQPNNPDHALRLDMPENMPLAMADREKVDEVLLNLMNNAMKYSPNGGPVVVGARESPGREMIEIRVSDRGLGIPEAELPRLFNKFHRVRSQATSGIKGTGLGLYIVKSLIEAMGGSVRVESKLGEGSTFFVLLAKAPTVADKGPHEPAVTGNTPASQAPEA